MQATINAPHTDLQGSVNHHISRLLKPFGGRTPLLLPVLLICILVTTARGQSNAQMPVSHPTNPAAPSDAQKAFEKMKNLAGSWQGTVMGKLVNITIRVASSSNTILNEATSGSGGAPDHEITMFYVDGDRLLATHYCDAGNRSRMEGKMSPDGKRIEFSFLDVAGGTQRGFTKSMVFTMIDANNHTGELTYILPDGKPVEARGEFQRTK